MKPLNKLITLKKDKSVLTAVQSFSRDTLKKKLAALYKENWEEHLRNNLEQNSNVPRSQEYSRTQASEQIEGRVTKKPSKESNWMESRFLGVLSQLDEFLLNLLNQGHP